LGLVAAGGTVTMLGQLIAERRGAKRAQREADERRIADELHELRQTVGEQALSLARLEGRVDGADGKDHDAPTP